MRSTPKRHVAAAGLVLTIALALAACSSEPRPETETTPEIASVQVYEVFGMDCPGCHGGLENLALDIPGVVTAKASWQEKRLTLGIGESAQVTEEEVRDAIARANFTAGERVE